MMVMPFHPLPVKKRVVTLVWKLVYILMVVSVLVRAEGLTSVHADAQGPANDSEQDTTGGGDENQGHRELRQSIFCRCVANYEAFYDVDDRRSLSTYYHPWNEGTEKDTTAVVMTRTSKYYRAEYRPYSTTSQDIKVGPDGWVIVDGITVLPLSNEACIVSQTNAALSAFLQIFYGPNASRSAKDYWALFQGGRRKNRNLLKGSRETQTTRTTDGGDKLPTMLRRSGRQVEFEGWEAKRRERLKNGREHQPSIWEQDLSQGTDYEKREIPRIFPCPPNAPAPLPTPEPIGEGPTVEPMPTETPEPTVPTPSPIGEGPTVEPMPTLAPEPTVGATSVSPTKSPTPSSTPSGIPSTVPSISHQPTWTPVLNIVAPEPSQFPTSSLAPTFSVAPSSGPTISSAPTTSLGGTTSRPSVTLEPSVSSQPVLNDFETSSAPSGNLTLPTASPQPAGENTTAPIISAPPTTIVPVLQIIDTIPQPVAAMPAAPKAPAPDTMPTSMPQSTIIEGPTMTVPVLQIIGTAPQPVASMPTAPKAPSTTLVKPGAHIIEGPTPFNHVCHASEIVVGNAVLRFGSTVDAAKGRNFNCSAARGLDNKSRGVWYTTVGNGNKYTVTTCFRETNFNTAIQVFSDSCDNLQCLAGAGSIKDPGCSSQRASAVTFLTEPGTRYYFLVFGRTAEDSGRFVLTLYQNERTVIEPPV